MPLTGNPSKDIRELAHSKHHRKRVRDQGKKGARRQEIAIAMATRDRKKRSGRRK